MNPGTVARSAKTKGIDLIFLSSGKLGALVMIGNGAISSFLGKALSHGKPILSNHSQTNALGNLLSICVLVGTTFPKLYSNTSEISSALSDVIPRFDLS